MCEPFIFRRGNGHARIYFRALCGAFGDPVRLRHHHGQQCRTNPRTTSPKAAATDPLPGRSPHEELTREVKLLDDGYQATTTTKNKELAAKLKEHVAYMQKRLGSGAFVRRWDPAFVEMVQYHNQLATKVELLEEGMKVVVTGKTPEAIAVAQNHAKIVSQFAKQGYDAVREAHEPALKDK